MKYLLLVHADEAGLRALSKADAERGLAAYAAYTEALRKAGVFVASERLQPTSATATVDMSRRRRR